MKLNEKIRIVRIAKGYTQEYIADRLNIDPANYGRIERGTAKINTDRLEEIANILEVSITELYSSESGINLFNRKEDTLKNSQQMLIELFYKNIELYNRLIDELKNINENWKILNEETKIKY